MKLYGNDRRTNGKRSSNGGTWVHASYCFVLFLVGIIQHSQLCPSGHTEVVGVLQVVKGYHQTSADIWSAMVRTIGGPKNVVEVIPVNGIAQPYESMAYINDLG
jgi:hypothetical protein